VPGGAAGLQNQSGGRKVPGGFDSLPSPPKCPGKTVLDLWALHRTWAAVNQLTMLTVCAFTPKNLAQIF
jgi:hypothetical protein